MKPLKTKVSITLDTDLIQSIKQLAEDDDRSFSQYINLILKEYLKSKEMLKSAE
ncbi:MAG: toxin-antitoxin system protein [Roseburia sp.]|nr:toxin-antitoxin system protein [Roseburia sp.]MCM1099679.1 toxin-antitoxin system protein [Ruminococcus flavefaciens]